MTQGNAYQGLTWSQIELDGSGLSGANCDRKVLSRQPLIEGRPDLGMTRRQEWCGELARWKSDQLIDNRRTALCPKHCREATAPPRRPQTLGNAIARYQRAQAKDDAIVRDMAGRQLLGRLVAGADPAATAPQKSAQPPEFPG